MISDCNNPYLLAGATMDGLPPPSYSKPGAGAGIYGSAPHRLHNGNHEPPMRTNPMAAFDTSDTPIV